MEIDCVLNMYVSMPSLVWCDSLCSMYILLGVIQTIKEDALGSVGMLCDLLWVPEHPQFPYLLAVPCTLWRLCVSLFLSQRVGLGSALTGR